MWGLEFFSNQAQRDENVIVIKGLDFFRNMLKKIDDILQAVDFSTFVIHFRQQFYRNLSKS